MKNQKYTAEELEEMRQRKQAEKQKAEEKREGQKAKQTQISTATDEE